MQTVNSWWRNLSVSKKLYGVVGVMAIMIATELFVLRFAMGTLSAVRAFVGGEGSWSKAQKEAVIALHNYTDSRDVVYFQQYTDQMRVPLGDRVARLEMEKHQPSYDAIFKGFVEGRIHPLDIPGIVILFQRFHDFGHLKEAIRIWKRADETIGELDREAQALKEAIDQKLPNSEVRARLARINQYDHELTGLEDEFSEVLGAGSRWMEGLLLTILTLVVLTIEGGGLILTMSFSRQLKRVLDELNVVAKKVGQGDFTQVVPIRSTDELGQLAMAINQMTDSLRSSQGQKQSAEQASQIKNLFLANMSHEIRTPLGSILGFTELLRDPNLRQEERLKYLDIIERTGGSLTKLINDILDITKIEAGHLEIEKANFSLQALLADLRNLLNLRAEGKHIELKFVAVGLPPDMIFSDAIRVRQILMNILGNAIKFTSRGTVTLEYGIRDALIYFKVTDTGEGIPVEKFNMLFQPFSQADDSTIRKHEGTGLGLVLSRRLARALGGDVNLNESGPKGSTFVATIAYEAPSFAGRPRLVSKESRKGIEGKRILVVDDVEENQLLVRILLERQGAIVSIAQNGRQGVDMALSGEFDVVLLDMQMPVLDGYTAVKELRSKGYTKPVIALTAHAMKEDRTRCINAGCDEYLSKPIQARELFEVLSRHVDDSESAKIV